LICCIFFFKKKKTGKENAVVWYYRWRTFYLAVAEMFNYDNGNIWCVGHYLFEKE
jgi:type I restriction-modification system DNA methylase subunit